MCQFRMYSEDETFFDFGIYGEKALYLYCRHAAEVTNSQSLGFSKRLAGIQNQLPTQQSWILSAGIFGMGIKRK